MFKIGVCVKSAIDPEELNPREREGKLELMGLRYLPNEPDRYAVQEALRLKEQLNGEVTIISVGPSYVTETIYESLARGADRAIHINYNLPFPEDPFLTAFIIHKVIKEDKFGLVMCGAQSVDNATCLTGGVLAELLGMSYVWGVTGVDRIEDEKIIVRREIPGGILEILEVKLPALLAVETGLTELKYVSFASLRAAVRKEVKIITPETLGISLEGFRVCNVKDLRIPTFEKEAVMIGGSPEEIARKLLEIFCNLGVLKL